MCFINVLLFLNLPHDKKSFRNTAWNSAEVNVQRSGEIFNKFYHKIRNVTLLMRITCIYFEKAETEMGGKYSPLTTDSGSVA